MNTKIKEAEQTTGGRSHHSPNKDVKLWDVCGGGVKNKTKDSKHKLKLPKTARTTKDRNEITLVSSNRLRRCCSPLTYCSLFGERWCCGLTTMITILQIDLNTDFFLSLNTESLPSIYLQDSVFTTNRAERLGLYPVCSSLTSHETEKRIFRAITLRQMPFADAQKCGSWAAATTMVEFL